MGEMRSLAQESIWVGKKIITRGIFHTLTGIHHLIIKKKYLSLKNNIKRSLKVRKNYNTWPQKDKLSIRDINEHF